MWTNVLLIGLTAGIAATVAVVTANLVMVQRGIDYEISDVPDVDSPGFLQLLAALLSLRLCDRNRIRLLLNGDEAFPAMLDAVRNAERFVMFENFVYWSGEIGRDFAELLSRKAQDGVHVHVVLDWVGSLKMDQRYLQQMRRAGVEIHRYHPPRFGSMHRLNHRTHRRELVVDGRVAFTGGIGFADEWAGDGASDGCRRDNHYELRGPLVTDMQAVFLDNWLKTSGDILFADILFEDGQPPQTQSPEERQAAVLRSSPTERTTTGRLLILMLIAAARRTIQIEQAYFVPDHQIRSALAEAAQRGVKVEILLPGNKIDYGFVRRASRALWGCLLEAGVKIYEYQPSMLHAKTLNVDDLWVLCGSANLDFRSLYRNDETYLLVRDKGFAEEHRINFERDKRKSKAISLEQWRSRSAYQKLADRSASLLRTQL